MNKGAIIGIGLAIILVGIFGSQFVKTPDSFQESNTSSELQETITLKEKTSTQSTNTQQTSKSSLSIQSISSKNCAGNARCVTGTVSKVIDGDTIVVGGQSVRLALASTPELNKSMGVAAKKYVQEICPVGSKVTVDEDDGQTQGSYGRIIGVVYCNGINVNAAVLEKGFGNLSFVHCDESEFSSNSWAKKGCSPSTKTQPSFYSGSYTTRSQSNCDPNYSGACVPISSYDLDCADIPSGVTVVGKDIHSFDRDGDGRGCE